MDEGFDFQHPNVVAVCTQVCEALAQHTYLYAGNEEDYYAIPEEFRTYCAQRLNEVLPQPPTAEACKVITVTIYRQLQSLETSIGLQTFLDEQLLQDTRGQNSGLEGQVDTLGQQLNRDER
eukprot:gene30200-36479_t